MEEAVEPMEEALLIEYFSIEEKKSERLMIKINCFF